MTNELTQEEKISLVESKIRTCTLMKESLENYLIDETDLEIIKQYTDGIEEYTNTINTLKVVKETMLK